MFAAFLPLLLLVSACFGLPLLGTLLASEPLGELLNVPLTARSFDALPLDQGVFAVTVLVLFAALMLVTFLAWPRSRSRRDFGATQGALFPTWGWVGTLLAALSPLAGRGPWSGFGLTLFLLGLTLLLNAETRGRTGSSLLSQRPWFFISLFPAGMVLGWIYHYLNLFLQLWHYPAAGGTLAFSIDASLGCAVLVPALLSLRQWMASFPGFFDLFRHGLPVVAGKGGEEGWMLIALGCVGLAGAGIWPDWIYPLTWMSPLLLAIGLQGVRDKSTLFSGAVRGDWSRILLPALSALILGIIALAWNQLAGPIWAYELPLIDQARVLGLSGPAYAGFLPLGLLGIWVTDQLARPWRNRPQGRFREFPFKVVIKH
jgi:hypothetical protein